MKNNNKKLMIFLAIVVVIFSFGIVHKEFQNDTFFNIAIGRHLLENGIDMKEHFTWAADNLYYSHSHWIFDILMYAIFNFTGFTGIHIFTLLFTAITGLTLFILLSRRSKSPVISFIVTLICMYIAKDAFTARSQVISFLFFIIEIYCIEKLIETNKRKYAIYLIASGIIIANFHAATWPLMLVLFMPYFAAAFLNSISFKAKNKNEIKKLEKKLETLNPESKEAQNIQEKINECQKYLRENDAPYAEYKIIRRKYYNVRTLLIVFILVTLTGLITPIHGTPYTYIVKSMFGESNFETGSSMEYILEMQPTIPIASLPFLVFTILIIGFITFLPTKIKTEHGFLLAGLYVMALSSNRYSFLLVFIGAYVLNELITNATNILIKDDIESLEKLLSTKKAFIALASLAIIFTSCNMLDYLKVDYINEELYPIGAVEYIKENLDYKNIRIYNSYNYGSYLMLNDIPVFIDSRLDVYCSEFNDTDIFYDYVQISNGTCHYDEVFDKYDFTHILLYSSDIIVPYIKEDISYNTLYEDEYFILLEKK